MNTEPQTPPPGYHTVTPSLTIRGAADAITFYQRAFGATEHLRLASPDGTVMHAEIRIGDSIIMLSDEFPAWGCLSPATIGGCPTSIMLYVPDADALFAQAIAAGATEVRPMTDQFWGDRSGMVADPFGYRWSLATQVEIVPPDEITRRAQAWTAAQG
jgi:PhnB protein